MLSAVRARAAVVVLGLLAAPAFANQVTSPRLHHTAPFLGRTLTLTVDGAQPLASVELYFNTQPGSYATPYGTLELQRRGARRLATGTTDAAGAWSFDLVVPLDPSLAESGAHFQAIVRDSSAPAGKVLTDAFHGRYLGSRVYAGHAGGMYVFGAESRSIVARVEASGAGSPYVPGKPLFDPEVTQGVVMSTSRELLFFDPYFGGVLARLPFANDASCVLLADAAPRTVYVLELASGATPPRIHAIDLASRSETGFLDLPYPVEPVWCAGAPGVDAYVLERSPTEWRVRRIGLEPLADLGSIHVGGPLPPIGSYELGSFDMAFASDELLVSSLGQSSAFEILGSLTRCKVGAAGLEASVVDMGRASAHLLTPVPALDRMLCSQAVTFTGPSGWLSQFRVHSIRGPAPVEPPFPSALYIEDIAVDGTTAWVLTATMDPGWCPGLYRLDLTTWTWTDPELYWCIRAREEEVLHDSLVNQVWVSSLSDPAARIRPAVTVVDAATMTSQKIRLDQDALVLHAVPLP